jgi:glycerol-3-phosphate dehydrogenase
VYDWKPLTDSWYGGRNPGACYFLSTTDVTLHHNVISLPVTRAGEFTCDATKKNLNFVDYLDYAKAKYHWLNSELLNRYLYSYGTNTEFFLAACTDLSSMGKCYGAELYQIELNYLIEYEWATTVEDILCRRTKLGLTMDEKAKAELTHYLESLIALAAPDQVELECH